MRPSNRGMRVRSKHTSFKYDVDAWTSKSEGVTLGQQRPAATSELTLCAMIASIPIASFAEVYWMTRSSETTFPEVSMELSLLKVLWLMDFQLLLLCDQDSIVAGDFDINVFDEAIGVCRFISMFDAVLQCLKSASARTTARNRCK